MQETCLICGYKRLAREAIERLDQIVQFERETAGHKYPHLARDVTGFMIRFRILCEEQRREADQPFGKANAKIRSRGAAGSCPVPVESKIA